MKLTPLGNRIIILPYAKKTETAGGLIIPEKAQREEGKGIIQKISPDIDPGTLKEGHHVYYSVGHCTLYEETGTIYHVAPIDAITAIIDNP
jgi:co-chaperonin GroES (HSP10)